MAERPRASRYCFACGEENPHGLRLRFRLEEGRAVAEFTAPEHLQGYPGRAHGGGVATVLDEAMGWACYAQGIWAMTARFTMRLRAPVRLETPMVATGWVVRDRGRFLELRAELRSADSALLAEAEGTFARVRGEEAEELRRLFDATVS